jgi:hypothetical protein
MIKTNRNDPCPCGSGKKYKKCCLLNQQSTVNVDLLYRRLRKIERELMHKIDNCFDKHYPIEAMEACWQEFNLWDDDLIDDIIDDFDAPENDYTFPVFRCFHWAVDIYDLPDNISIPEQIPAQYLLEHNKHLSELEQEFAVTAMSSPFSFYLIKAVDVGQSMLLEEFFTGQQIQVIEQQASIESVVDSIIYTCVISLQGLSFMLGMAPYPFPSSYALELLPFKETMIKHHTAWSNELIADFDTELRDFYFGLRERMLAPPIMVNNNDEAIVLHNIEYQLLCSSAYAQEKLASLNKLEPHKAWGNAHCADEQLSTGTIHWLEKINGQYISCALLTLTDDRLVINVNSDERASAIKRKITRRLGKQALLMSDERSDMDTLQDLALSTNVSDGNDASPDQLAQLAQLEHEFLQQYYRDWLDKPVPALGNQTPRQTSKSEQGREKLSLLLNDFERNGQAPVDWLRAQLNIK